MHLIKCKISSSKYICTMKERVVKNIDWIKNKLIDCTHFMLNLINK